MKVMKVIRVGHWRLVIEKRLTGKPYRCRVMSAGKICQTFFGRTEKEAIELGTNLLTGARQ